MPSTVPLHQEDVTPLRGLISKMYSSSSSSVWLQKGLQTKRITPLESTLFPLNRSFISSYEVKLGRNSLPMIRTNYVHNDKSSEASVSKICIDKERNAAVIRYPISEHTAELLFTIINDAVVLNKFIAAPKSVPGSGIGERPVPASSTTKTASASSTATPPPASASNGTGVAIATSSDPVNAQYLTQLNLIST